MLAIAGVVCSPDFGSDIARLLCSVAQSVIASGCVSAVLSDAHLVAVTATVVVDAVDLSITLLDCSAVEVRVRPHVVWCGD